MSVSFCSFLDSCLIGNHTTSSFLYYIIRYDYNCLTINTLTSFLTILCLIGVDPIYRIFTFCVMFDAIHSDVLDWSNNMVRSRHYLYATVHTLTPFKPVMAVFRHISFLNITFTYLRLFVFPSELLTF